MSQIMFNSALCASHTKNCLSSLRIRLRSQTLSKAKIVIPKKKHNILPLNQDDLILS